MTIKKRLKIPSLCFTALMLILVDSVTTRQTVYGSLVPDRSVVKASQYVSFVKQMAPAYGVKPELVLAVMKTESAFNPKAVSGAGALGLMQLMPNTAQGEYEEVFGEAVEPEFFKRQLLDQPDLNILLAIRHLSELERSFRHVRNLKKRRALVLASYNAGFKRVRHAFECPRVVCVGEMSNHLTWLGFQEKIAKLPRETRLYIKIVGQNHQVALALL